jgi:hypothetical protein
LPRRRIAASRFEYIERELSPTRPLRLVRRDQFSVSQTIFYSWLVVKPCSEFPSCNALGVEA